MDNKEIRRRVANNVRTLMNQAGFSSTELSAKSGIAQGTISKIISGHTGITVPILVNLARGLDKDVHEILNGVLEDKETKKLSKKTEPNKSEPLSIGVLSINNKRITCIKNNLGNVIGTSLLDGGLDLVKTSGSVLDLIQQAIDEALSNGKESNSELKNAKLNLVTQSYEFEDARKRFLLFAQKHFKEILLLPDWQIIYLADFGNEPGISLITDKGISVAYRHKGRIKKLGGWKFPVYDKGGENWLGAKTIQHTIEAAEGYIPMSNLARDVLAKFNNKIEKITETCFKGTKDPDIYSTFCELLFRNYYTKDETAKVIIKHGFEFIDKAVKKVDSILGKKLKIAINGSLAEIYKPFFQENRLITPSSEAEKAKLLADIAPEFLAEYGIKNMWPKN